MKKKKKNQFIDCSGESKMRRLLAVFVLCQSLLGPPVEAQIDGSFWWMNTELVKKAEEYRQDKDVKANVVNNVSLDTVTVKRLNHHLLTSSYSFLD